MIQFREIKMEGGWLMVHPVNPGEAMRAVSRHKDRLYDLEIKEHRERRSLDSNAYCWTLIGKLAEEMRITPREVYRNAIQNIGGNYEVLPIRKDAVKAFSEAWESHGIGWPCVDMGDSKIPGYVNVRAYYGSSTYDKRQMGMLIDSLIADCKELRIETLPPDKIAAMMEGWE